MLLSIYIRGFVWLVLQAASSPHGRHESNPMVRIQPVDWFQRPKNSPVRMPQVEWLEGELGLLVQMMTLVVG